MMMNHMVGGQTLTTLATNFHPSLGEYVLFSSSPLYIFMLALFKLIGLQFLLVYDLENPIFILFYPLHVVFF
jgi:hypothetical protein